MKSKFMVSVFSVLLLSIGSYGQRGRQNLEEITELRREIRALEQLKSQKLDDLERAEARRWNQRYAQNEELNLLQSRARQLESRYGVIASELNRRQDDISLLRNALDDARIRFEDAERSRDRFTLQLQSTVRDISDRLDSDFPWKINYRTALYSSLLQNLEASDAMPESVIDRFFSDRFERIRLGETKSLTTRLALFGDGTERKVWNLRLGTVAMIDFDKTDNSYQSLLRTGALQGARYAFRTNLGAEYPSIVQNLVIAIQDEEPTAVPLDILQDGRIGTAVTTEELSSLRERFLSWFGQGGLIMYPLLLVALIALLIALERFVTLSIRHHRYTVSYRKLIPLIIAEDWKSVEHFCTRGCGGLTRAIQEVIHHRNGSREKAEQQVKQILLAEVPALEKRLSLVSALGATAPLLGLLGTVSGMISLFRVITDTGTNDARILAGGISEALVTTQTGLLIAIPILLVHGYLVERLDDILSHYNETVLEVFNLVFNRKGTPE